MKKLVSKIKKTVYNPVDNILSKVFLKILLVFSFDPLLFITKSANFFFLSDTWFA